MAISNVVGFDDAPFARSHRGDVRVVGVVCARTRCDGILSGFVRRDGRNSTDRMITLVAESNFAQQVQAVLLQGIAVAGFNVVDVHRLHDALGVPVVVVARRRPDLPRIRRALLTRVPGGERKWRLVEAAGEMEPCGEVFVQRVGIDPPSTRALLAQTTLHGNLPEPLRLAHLVAGGITTGHSRGRA